MHKDSGPGRPTSGPWPDDAPAPLRRWRWLLAVCGLLVVHGSLYPWHFEPSVSASVAWAEMWAEADLWTSLGDVVGNLVLFIPVGLLAAKAWPGRGAWAFVIFALGVLFALALQVLQFWVPERSPAWADVWWNSIGMALGQAAVALSRRWRPYVGTGRSSLASPLLVVAGLWLAIEWWPFLPTIDFQHVKDALKPLLLTPRWSWRSFVDATLSLLVVAQLARGMRTRALLIVALVAAAVLGKLFLRGQVLSLPHVSGWCAGLALAPLLWRLPVRAASWLVLALALGWFTFDELRPFAWSDEASDFSWIPFVASLRGSLISNTAALCWQLFWLGAALLAGRALGGRTGAIALALAGWALALEWHQAWLPGRVADITPAVLPLLWWLALPLLDSRGAATPLPPQPVSPRRAHASQR